MATLKLEINSQFFNCKIYRKGTLHITFKEESLWREFNIRATKGKAWLPEADWVKFQKEKNKEKAKEKSTNLFQLLQLEYNV